MHVLLIEDDDPLHDKLIDVLEAAGIGVTRCGRVTPAALRTQLERIEQASASPGPGVVVVGDVTISFQARAVWAGRKQVSLTAKEYSVLELLAHRPGQVVSRRDIEDAVWGPNQHPATRSLDVHMASLRAKLGRPALIQTVRGYGYRLGTPLGGPDALVS